MSIDFRKVKVPFRGKEDIKAQVEVFQKKYWDGKFPVNIEKIIEVKLKIDMVPVSELMSLCDTDALITSNWKQIYVDRRKFCDERYENRLRFTLAHEIGHMVLHHKLYSGFSIDSIENYYKFIEGMPDEQYGYLETQANRFASYLLIPREQLAKDKEKELNQIRHLMDKELKNVNETILYSYIANPLSKVYGVSTDALEIALRDLNEN